MTLERFFSAWREEYVTAASAGEGGGCVFCRLADAEVDASTGVVWRDDLTYVALNAFPYGSGHLLVLPRRHVSDLSGLTDEESAGFWAATRLVAGALYRAYSPDGMNIGLNLGVAAGAGIPQHLHGHVLPRWAGDTNFMTSIGETRVLPESLASTWAKVHGSLGSGGGASVD